MHLLILFSDSINPEINRRNDLLREVHNHTIPLADLVHIPVAGVEEHPALISSITKYLESNIVCYTSSQDIQEAEHVSNEPNHHDEPAAPSPDDSGRESGRGGEKTG